MGEKKKYQRPEMYSVPFCCGDPDCLRSAMLAFKMVILLRYAPEENVRELLAKARVSVN